MDEKDLFRNKQKQALKARSANQRTHDSQQLMQRLAAQPYWQQANSISVTIPMPFEVDTRWVIARAWQEGKRVCVPKTGPSGHMEMIWVTPDTALHQTRFGIFEPIKCDAVAPKADIDLIVVPCLAIDVRTRRRLGFGGGYYDRYLDDYCGETVALLFAEQHQLAVPTEAHDAVIAHLLVAE